MLVAARDIAQTTAVRTNPHRTLGIASQVDNVVTHQTVLQAIRHLHLLDGDVVVPHLHDKDTVCRSCPHLAVFGYSQCAHLLVSALRIALQRVLRVDSDIFSGFVLAQDVHTAAVCRYPDVAVVVLNGLIGGIAAQRPCVTIRMTEILHVISAAGGRNLKHALVLVAHPVVTLRVHRHTVRAADGRPLGVLGDGTYVVALGVINKNFSALVAEECQVALGVIAHGTHLVIHRVL